MLFLRYAGSKCISFPFRVGRLFSRLFNESKPIEDLHSTLYVSLKTLERLNAITSLFTRRFSIKSSKIESSTFGDTFLTRNIFLSSPNSFIFKGSLTNNLKFMKLSFFLSKTCFLALLLSYVTFRMHFLFVSSS